MNWNSSIRQFHRWVSIVFTVTVIANFVALAILLRIDWENRQLSRGLNA